jgi:Cu(I)/Ag(I) efflux system membrane fusion protein
MRRTLWTLGTLLPALLALPAVADTAAFDAAMKPIVAPYLKIHDALARDSVEGVKKDARAIARAAKKLDPSTVTGEHAEHYKTLPQKIAAAAKDLSAAKDIAAAREAFKALSRPIAMWTQMSEPEGLHVVFCSMAKASWVQRGEEVRNPYYGQKMLTCGEVLGGPASQGHPKGGHGGMEGMKHHGMKAAP